MTDIRKLREAMRELTYIHLYYKKKNLNERLSDETYDMMRSMLMAAISEIEKINQAARTSLNGGQS